MIPMPKDSGEREILEQLTLIRDRLLLLKQDRANYIRSQDVFVLYNQTIEQVRLLNDLRKGQDKTENRGKKRSIRLSRDPCTNCPFSVDKVLEGCFQLLSLFFMTIGRTSEAPAAYALTSTIKRLLDHLTEAALFSAKDLDSMSSTLEKIEAIVKHTDTKHSPYLVELLSNRIQLCEESIANLQGKLDSLGDPLPAVHEKMISILRSTSLANTKAKVGSLQNKPDDA